MAHILIDGYNLIGIAHDELEKARNNLIQQLQRYSDLKGHNITLVFDGWKSGQFNETKTQVGNITVIFSKLGEKADFVIKKILSKASRQWIVVSSDREIAGFAKRKGFVSITTEEFERKLYPPVGSVEKIEEPISIKNDEDIDIVPAKRKGNPRRPSKRQKQKLIALKKL